MSQALGVSRQQSPHGALQAVLQQPRPCSSLLAAAGCRCMRTHSRCACTALLRSRCSVNTDSHRLCWLAEMLEREQARGYEYQGQTVFAPSRGKRGLPRLKLTPELMSQQRSGEEYTTMLVHRDGSVFTKR